ncbi:hypothetical protein HNP84_010068 [Thermocatellispora tengchongensis]|uniref:MucR family transcriptional regulator n=1 Tax=Thermocatellispora tengchongensis TaxID=1073253 RepID=A0A840PRB5_9ACTN|nr:hypothetical protein [Thermocatellispora tengchongensis]MBB5140301.1 hypothetical protein [Thermocatellispora tengchongensis]
MDPDTFRGGLEEASADVYWRRRMALLVGVLVVVAVVAWACSSTSNPDRVAKPAPSGSAAPDPILASLRASRTPRPSVTPKPAANKTTPTPAAPTAEARRPGDRCSPDDLVLSLRTEQEVYPGGVRPRFMLTLVNTGHVMCTADVGPRAIELRITSGEDRIWSSADCISGAGVDIRRLERGIPYVRPVEWDRMRSAQSCGSARLNARPGTYVAVVRADELNSPKAVFHLR